MSYVALPSAERLEVIYEHVKNLADRQHKSLRRPYGVVEFSLKQMGEELAEKLNMQEASSASAILSAAFNSLRRRGYADRHRRGTTLGPAVWDFKEFLTRIDELRSDDLVRNARLDIPSAPEKKDEASAGKGSIKVEFVNFEEESEKPEQITLFDKENKQEKIEVQVEATTENAKETTNNVDKDTLSALNEGIQEMLDFVKVLPNEITDYLTSLQRDLKYVDPQILIDTAAERDRLKKEVAELNKRIGELHTTKFHKEQYEKQLQELKRELEKAQQKTVVENKISVTSEQEVIRQRQLIMDELDRIFSTPVFRIHKEESHYKASIHNKLEAIMRCLDIEQ